MANSTSILKGTLPRPAGTELKQAVTTTTSVKFSENATYHGDHKKTTQKSKIVQYFTNVCAPLVSCRKRTLKRVHCRSVLVAICALVVIECVCVLSELMVDLQGIKFRFENEAREINKFVDHFRSKYPEAFEQVDILRTKDFIELLKSSTVHRDSDRVISKLKCPFHHQVNHRKVSALCATGPHNNNKDFRLLGEGSRSKKRGHGENTRLNNDRHSPGAESPHLSTTASTSLTSSGVQTPKMAEIRSSPVPNQTPGFGSENNVIQQAAVDKCIGKCLTTRDKNHKVLSIATTTVSPIYVTKNKNDFTTDSVSPTKKTSEKDKANGTTEINIINSTDRKVENISRGDFEQGVLKNDSVFKGNANVSENNIDTSTLPSIIDEANNYQENLTEKHASGKSFNRTGAYNPPIKDVDHNNDSIVSNLSHPQQTAEEMGHNNTTNTSNFRTRRSVMKRNESKSLIESLSNMFVLEIKDDQHNFFLVLEVLPERIRNNGTKFLKYKDEYKKIYTTSKALHFTSLSILGIMVIETLVKLFCTGLSFFKKKLEVFDALIVISSFALDVTFLDSRWYETGKDATALLVLLLPWRVVRIVNSFLMTVKHKHHIQVMNLKRSKKKAEIKMTKLQTLLTEIRKDVQLLTNLCRFHDVDENNINACLYGKGRRGATLDAMTTCTSLMLISTLGKDTFAQQEDVYSTVIQEVLNDGHFSAKDEGKKKEAEAAIDAAIAMDDKIEAKRRSRRPSRLKRAILQRTHTFPRRCASVEMAPDDDGESSVNNVFYIHDMGQDENAHVYVNCQQPSSKGDVFYVSDDGGSRETSHRPNISDL